MPGLDTDIVVHKIPLKPECKPVKQALRRMKPEVILKIKEEQQTPCSYSWTDSQAIIRSKWPKKINPKTALVTHWGTFVYDVMPFGLKNVGATYQRAMVTLFHDMIHHEIEVYVDDMIAKSRTTQDHLIDLRKLFQRLKKYQLRLNLNKCALASHLGNYWASLSAAGELRLILQRFKLYEYAYAKNRERDSKLLGKDQLHSSLHCTAHCNLRTTVQAVEKRCKDKEGIHGLLVGTTRRDWEEGASNLLSQQEVHGTGDPLYAGKIARWQVLLSEFDILFVALKAIKGQAIANYLVDYPSEQLELMDSEFPDEDVMIVDEGDHCRWKLYFDGAANAIGSGIGAVLVSPKGQQTPIAVKLGFDCTNNMTEYEACIVSLQVALEARDPKLIPYQQYIGQLVPKFKYITFTYTLRAHNHFADALATLASLIKLVEGMMCDHCGSKLETSQHTVSEEANRLIQEMHAGLMGAHANGPFLAQKIIRAGYYWLTMERDCIRHVQTCHKCQMYQNCKNAPPQYLHTMASPWSFSAWGMDVIDTITPKASNGHEFILVAIDYFTKWAEACSFKNVTQVVVTRFVKNNIICHYGMPEMLITDNASNLNNRMMDQLCQQFKIQHHNSASYRPKMNGAVEAANKNVKKILNKMTETYKYWHEHLPYALCAYQTSVRTSVGATLYSFVYGMEAVLPVEMEIPSLRILSQTQLDEVEWAQARYE
uniref:Integrase catalytic domain-containing protein n=1 Tax=Fagus sylvatica TaxID=28930 RepID=A0A2N9EY32_FAGSY